jgi:hypothetical protein
MPLEAQASYTPRMRRRWRNLLSALGLTRVGRIVFTSVALLGVALALADVLIPRPEPESDLGENVGGAVGAFTIGVLALVAAGDAIVRLAWRMTRHFVKRSQ